MAILVVVCLGIWACKPADPLDTIRRQQAAGDFVSTVEPLRELVVERPSDAEVNYLYGLALLYTGRASLATWPLLQAMEDPEWLERAGVQLAQSALVTGDLNQAVDVATRVLETNPDNAHALLYRAQAHAHWKLNPEAALADAVRVLELEPGWLEAYEPRILALLALGRHAEAEVELEEAGRLLAASDAPADSLAWHCSTSAVFAEEGGHAERAKQIWSECLSDYSTNPNVVLGAIQFFDKAGDWDRGLEILRAAQAAAPGARVFRMALTERLRRTGKTAEAEALLREATSEKDPRLAANAWADLAQFRHSLGEHGAAADALARAIERAAEVSQESDPQLLFRYADALMVSGQLDRALEVAEEIPVPAQQKLIRARVAQERGQYRRALEAYDEALRVWPNNPWARYYAAVTAEKLGDLDRALEEYRYSVRISPGATDARTRGARLLVAENRPLHAYQLIFLQVAEAPLEPEGELLSMYLMGRVANPAQLRDSLVKLAARNPAMVPMALSRGAEGAAEAAGPAAALQLLVSAPGIDYTRPAMAPTLRTLVRLAHEAGKKEVAERAIDAALGAQPQASVFHEIRARHLELGGAAPDEVRAAYERAVELDPANAHALAGLGRCDLEQDPSRALTFFDRALAAEPEEPDAALDGVRALLAQGDSEEAARRLDAILDDDPLSRRALLERVSLDLRRQKATDQTLERAQRAVRLGGGAEALDLLSEVHTLMGDSELAARAAERAREIRSARPTER